MSLLGFKKQFAGPVERREKRQTIRAKVHGHQVGRPIQLYTGLRTKACRKLADVDPVCVSIDPVVIAWGGYCKIGGTLFGGERMAAFAAADGFASTKAFFEFFCPDKATFTGFLIRWEWLGEAKP
jgi:hypothetical protein